MSCMQADGVTNVAMEVSSHAIAQCRIVALEFDYLIFSNITPDHLDFHSSFAEYVATKQRLFTSKGIKGIVTNYDDPYGRELYKRHYQEVAVVCYGCNLSLPTIRAKYVLASNVVYNMSGFSCDVATSWGNFSLRSALIGSFNISNVLAVVAYLLLNGIGIAAITTVVARLQPVPGRMQTFKRKNSSLVVVDYAHTADALEQVLSFIRKTVACGKIWVVFGCGGERDKARRYGMATVARSLSDHIIVTADNPRAECLQEINADICKVFCSSDQVEIIDDRAEAISYALKNAVCEDVVLIVGKGHESTQEINGRKIKHSDIACVERFLAEVTDCIL